MNVAPATFVPILLSQLQRLKVYPGKLKPQSGNVIVTPWHLLLNEDVEPLAEPFPRTKLTLCGVPPLRHVASRATKSSTRCATTLVDPILIVAGSHPVCVEFACRPTGQVKQADLPAVEYFRVPVHWYFSSSPGQYHPAGQSAHVVPNLLNELVTEPVPLNNCKPVELDKY